MHEITFPLLMSAISLLLAYCMSITPRLASPSAPLGVRVPVAYQNADVVHRALRRYRRICVGGGLIVALLCTAAWRVFLFGAVSSLLLIPISLYAYVSSRRLILEAKHRERWFDDSETRIVGKITHAHVPEVPAPSIPWIAIFSSLLILVSAAVFVASHWQEIPERFVTHWGSDFQPDGWADKSIGSVFFATFMGLGAVAIFLILTWVISTLRVHPRTDRSYRGYLRTTMSLALSNRILGWLILVMSAGIAVLHIVTLMPSVQAYISAAIIAFLVLTVGSAVAGIALIVRELSHFNRALADFALPDGMKDQTESPDNDEFYVWGIFYYNPDDPAILVDKRFGVGMDFNYAKWQVKAGLAIFAAVCVGVLIVVIV